MTPQRKVIVETFLETEGHFSAEDLLVLVQKRAPEVGQATVYRALKLLVDSGLAESLDFGCGMPEKVEVVDNGIEQRQEVLARENGYVLTHHRMLLFGLCPECQKLRDKELDLES
ncbi:Ferric-uptake regulator like protein [Aduncisulcus paluster]|uniref:Ferric-uptake regulator like protein n=1 Tax=Aduncisulcus paluster TaxID=2918883 RepID=A0ABQ5KB35_9EUKA|nr:Ferric-uptake regulator like protein [Aduncisulcus paluster]